MLARRHRLGGKLGPGVAADGRGRADVRRSLANARRGDPGRPLPVAGVRGRPHGCLGRHDRTGRDGSDRPDGVHGFMAPTGPTGEATLAGTWDGTWDTDIPQVNGTFSWVIEVTPNGLEGTID